MRGGFVRSAEAVAPDAYVSGIARVITALPDRVDHEGTAFPGFCPKLGRLFTGNQTQFEVDDTLSCEHFGHFLYNSKAPLSTSYMNVWDSIVTKAPECHAIIR